MNWKMFFLGLLVLSIYRVIIVLFNSNYGYVDDIVGFDIGVVFIDLMFKDNS